MFGGKFPSITPEQIAAGIGAFGAVVATIAAAPERLQVPLVIVIGAISVSAILAGAWQRGKRNDRAAVENAAAGVFTGELTPTPKVPTPVERPQAIAGEALELEVSSSGPMLSIDEIERLKGMLASDPPRSTSSSSALDRMAVRPFAGADPERTTPPGVVPNWSENADPAEDGVKRPQAMDLEGLPERG